MSAGDQLQDGREDRVQARITAAWSAIRGLFDAADPCQPVRFEEHLDEAKRCLEELATAGVGGVLAGLSRVAARLWSGATPGSSMHGVALDAVRDLVARLDALARTEERLELVRRLAEAEADMLGSRRFRDTIVPDCLAAERVAIGVDLAELEAADAAEISAWLGRAPAAEPRARSPGRRQRGSRPGSPREDRR